MYESVWLKQDMKKESVNIEDIRNDHVLSAKAEAWMTHLVSQTYDSKKDYESTYRYACKKFEVLPKNRLDINLIYWRLLGEKMFLRNKSFEQYSVQEMPDMEDIVDTPESEEDRTTRVKLENFVRTLVQKGEEGALNDKNQFEKVMRLTRRQYHIGPSKLEMQSTYSRLTKQTGEGRLQRSMPFEHLCIKKGVRSESGVLVVTVLTSPYPEGSDGKPGRFDCAYDCAYCPSEPGMPRSYISTEPAVRRAIQNNWDPVYQFVDRVSMLADCGHTVDKIEVLVLGGTWSSYPLAYRENFVRDLFYTANTKLFLPEDQREIREKKSLREERQINETAQHKVIGVTLETRPDCIDERELRHFRDCGCTRVQLGVQHTDNVILKKVKRACNRKDIVRGIGLLKNAGFKVDIHLMPDLPFSNYEKDMEMFKDVLYSPDLQADQWKIYPTSVVRHSAIEKWYEQGLYKPYADIDNGKILLELVVLVKDIVHPWIRLNRVIRDIPEISILGGNDDTNMRQKVARIMKARNLECYCIRCREVRDRATPKDIEEAELVVRKYAANGGTEYFISFESPEVKTPLEEHTPVPPFYTAPAFQAFVAVLVLLVAIVAEGTYCSTISVAILIVLLHVFLFFTAYGNNNPVKEQDRSIEEREEEYMTGLLRNHPKRSMIYAFLRLRVNGDPSENVFEELKHAGLIRELHVYGVLISVSDKTVYKDRAQHSGFGRKLIDRAIEITQSHGLKKIAVISGDGVKGYYRKQGFEDEENYLTREL